MRGYKVFTIDEARLLLPVLKDLVQAANDDLEELLCNVKFANDRYELAEKRLDGFKSSNDGVVSLSELRICRAQFQEAIEQLSKAQNEYVRRLNIWVDKITGHGVILRDLREGLLDFPAREGELEYLLCWRIDEPEIRFWHLDSDGFQGRKPLAALKEYF